MERNLDWKINSNKKRNYSKRFRVSLINFDTRDRSDESKILGDNKIHHCINFDLEKLIFIHMNVHI